MKTTRGMRLKLKILAFLFVVSCSTGQELDESIESEVLTPPKRNRTNSDGDEILADTPRKVAHKEKAYTTIKGYLKKTKPNGSIVPVKVADIVLQSEDYEEIARVKTGKSGFFQFTIQIPMGDYSIIYNDGVYHRVFNLTSTEKDMGTLNINPIFD